MNNYDSVVSQLTGSGLIIDGGLEIGRMRRCKVEGDREKRGWYSLHEVTGNDGGRLIVGSYGIWRGNDNNTQKITIDRKALDPAQAEALKKRIAEDRKRADAQRKQEAARAAQEAAKVWRSYLQTGGPSDYLARKNVGAHGVRWSPAGNGTFAVPMMDASGGIHGLQIIRGKDRGKKLEKEYFPRGLAKKGRFHLIGVVRDIVLVAEGYATAATLHEATGLPVAVAFDAGNLQPVAEALHKHHSRAGLLVCADDDYLTDGNPGCKAAETAALSVGGAWCKPEFITDREGKKLTDFNDLAAQDGIEQVARIIREAVAKMPQVSARPALLAREPLNKGGGESVAMPSLISIDDAVARYWGTYGLGGKVLFDEVDRRLVTKDDVMNILPERAWQEIKRHPDWRVARDTEIGFDPTETDRTIRCNLFGGWPTVPEPGRCDMLLDLLRYLCSMEKNGPEIFDWILKWLAYPIQHRGAKMHSAVVVQGPQGTGKSRFFEAYAKIFGQYGRVLGQEALEDKFNADWAEKKLFILADEVLARQDMYHVKNRLKGFITGDSIRVNPKNVAAHTEKNQMNIVFLSNERQPLVLENDDRRHAVIWTPPKPDEKFFAEVNAEIDGGGIAALHHYLLTLDLGDFKPWTKPPMTSAKLDLINLGKGSEERFIDDWINGDTQHPVSVCASADLYRAYQKWSKANGVNHPREMNQFLGYIGKIPGWANHRVRYFPNTHYSGEQLMTKCIFPPENLLNQHKTDNSKAKNKSQWITDSIFTFRETLETGP